MKKLLISFLITSAAAPATAAAADMPLKAQQASVAPPTWSWTGFYVGGHVGSALENSALQDPFGPVSFGDRVTTTSILGGGQIGANYQRGQVVVGTEADVSAVNSRGDETCFGVAGGNFFASNCSVAPTLLGTVTGRLGYAFGRTLVYGKAGAAWQHTDVDMAVDRNPGEHFLASTNSYGEWGWTMGAGVEYALTSAWSLKLEYDYLDFGSANVATPYVAGNPLPGHPVGPIAGVSSNVQELKMGFNYRFGADPSIWTAASTWSTLLVPSMPVKAPRRAVAASGWEIEGGARYMFSSGREQWEQADGPTSPPTWLSSSKLTWNNMQSNSAELFGRIDTPWNVFFNGFVGIGSTVKGGQNDEDFNNAPPETAYNNTFSVNNGGIDYAVVDLGYDVLRNSNIKLGPFVGYTMFHQSIFKSGCQQVASATGNCSVLDPTDPPISSSQLIGTENMTWQGVRIGVSGQVVLADRWKLSAEAAYLPYVTFNWLDDHLQRNLQVQMLGQGIGVQTQAVLSYDLTDRLSIGIGGRYWAMWSTSAGATYMFAPPTVVGPPIPNRNNIDLLGAFTQLSYRFASDPTTAAKPGGLELPFFKAPVVRTNDWTGFYAGIEGGAVWGKSIQIGQTTSRDTFDATPWFDVNGGMLGGTVGYNAQFARLFVYGLEGDISWADAAGSTRQTALDTRLTASTTENWLATTRVRFGVTPGDHWLVYATGGLAIANVMATITPSTPSLGSDSHVRPGWTAGGGVEASLIGNWSARLEYLFVGLENTSYFVPSPNNPAVDNRAGGVPFSNNIVRAGVTYRFGSL